MIWEIDPTHSRVSFAIRVLSVTTTRGRFKTFRGHLHLDEQSPASSWVEAEVDAASIDTHIMIRDVHLRSTAFFAVKKYPTIAFQSTKVEQVDGQNYKVTGNLTLLGVTRPITFDVQYRGQKSAKLGARTGMTAQAMINRKEFALGRGLAVQFAAGEMVTIEIDLEAVQRSAEEHEAPVTNRTT